MIDDFFKQAGITREDIIDTAMLLWWYISGFKGHFDYTRFDQQKPGILGSLGPFLDDIVAGLIGGVSAKMYDRGAANATTPR